MSAPAITFSGWARSRCCVFVNYELRAYFWAGGLGINSQRTLQTLAMKNIAVIMTDGLSWEQIRERMLHAVDVALAKNQLPTQAEIEAAKERVRVAHREKLRKAFEIRAREALTAPDPVAAIVAAMEWAQTQ